MNLDLYMYLYKEKSIIDYKENFDNKNVVIEMINLFQNCRLSPDLLSGIG